MEQKSQILLYQTKIDVRLEEDTVWLFQVQMAELFGKSRTTINEHISNVLKEGQLQEEVVSRKFRHNTKHGAIQEKTLTKEVKYY